MMGGAVRYRLLLYCSYSTFQVTTFDVIVSTCLTGQGIAASSILTRKVQPKA